MKKNLDEVINEFKSKVDSLVQRGYAPVAYFSSDTSDKSYQSVKNNEARYSNGVKMGEDLAFNRYHTSVKVEGCGKEGLGYIRWGEDNLIPVRIEKLADALPYTAQGLDYIANLLAGNGLGLMYNYVKIVNGEPKSVSIPYENAGVVIASRINELREKIKEASKAPKDFNVSNPDDPNSNVSSSPSVIQYRKKSEPQEDPSAKYANRNYDDIGSDEQLLQQAIEDYRKWEETMEWVVTFVRNSGDLDNIIQQWASDTVYYNLSFIRLQLEQGTSGAWGEVKGGTVKSLDKRPRIVGVSYQPTQCSRFEQMDDNLHINNIYYAEKWRYEGTIKDISRNIVSIPCIEPQSRWKDLTDIVLQNQNTKPSMRPSVVAPIYVGKTKSPYYPINPWWSIFPSCIYNLAVTLMTDTATARRNSTMWSKIIYLDVEWFDRYATQKRCETDEEREKLREEVINEIKKFLTDRSNNGKTVTGDKMPSPDGSKNIYSFEVVDVPQPTSKTSLEDLEKITSCIFFALGIHPALVGAVPGHSGGSTSGTQQRELTLLKQLQLTPKQKQILSVFNFIKDWNNLDTHLCFSIKKYVLSTLDRSNTGLVEDSDI